MNIKKKQEWFKHNFHVCVNSNPRYLPALPFEGCLKELVWEESSLPSLLFYMSSACGRSRADRWGSKVRVAMWPVIGSIWKWSVLSSWVPFWDAGSRPDLSWFTPSFPIRADISSNSWSHGKCRSGGSASSSAGSVTYSTREAWRFCRDRDWTVWKMG